MALARQPGALNVACLHRVDHSALDAPEMAAAYKAQLRMDIGGIFIAPAGLPLDPPDPATVYTPEAKGCTDHPRAGATVTG